MVIDDCLVEQYGGLVQREHSLHDRLELLLSIVFFFLLDKWAHISNFLSLVKTSVGRIMSLIIIVIL